MNFPRDTENYEPFIPVVLVAMLIVGIFVAYLMGAFS